MGAELFHEDSRTDRRTGMTKLKVALRNIANAPRNDYTNIIKKFCPEYNLALFQTSWLLLMYLHQLPNRCFNLQVSL